MAVSEHDLGAALDAELGSGSQLAPAAAALSAAYRSGGRPGRVLDDPTAARAYAAVRMPATFAAVRAALRAAGPDLRPATLLDLGGGTGAAIWAAAATLPSLLSAQVLDGAAPALALGRALAAHAPDMVLAGATWTQARWPAELPAADLVTLAYFVGELRAEEQVAAVAAAAERAGAVAVVEPGTPAGFGDLLRARDTLLGKGFRIVAPCPHDQACPWAAGPDWCHFPARLPRSARHRQVKGGRLGWEDEKFSYVVAVRAGTDRPGGRIVRHPFQRKGMVELTVCAARPGVQRVIVSKRRGADYKAARDAGWGDAWPPHP
ncbi:MAG TPA: small ribosomal subunit Rsm22 family protein [Mycobacteriales bacterium]|nr:small ribosomal subunit Rsm22 family protein [Mycobacteriales bacterium]